MEKEGHVLFFDNYFNSHNLLQVLKGKGIFAGGTAREYRFANPPFLNNKKISEKKRVHLRSNKHRWSLGNLQMA